MRITPHRRRSSPPLSRVLVLGAATGAFVIVGASAAQADGLDVGTPVRVTSNLPTPGDALDSVGDTVEDAVDSVGDTVEDAVHDAAETVGDTVHDAAETVGGTVDDARGALEHPVPGTQPPAAPTDPTTGGPRPDGPGPAHEPGHGSGTGHTSGVVPGPPRIEGIGFPATSTEPDAAAVSDHVADGSITTSVGPTQPTEAPDWGFGTLPTRWTLLLAAAVGILMLFYAATLWLRMAEDRGDGGHFSTLGPG
jgi:hypothetical protein